MSKYNGEDSFKIKVLKEEIDISKNKIQTGDVNIYKDVIEEEKTFTVPVTREELVIEKKIFRDGKDSGKVETMRIPVSEEQVEISKHSVILEDVDIYDNEYEIVEQVKEMLKREELRVETSGDAKVIDKKVD